MLYEKPKQKKRNNNFEIKKIKNKKTFKEEKQ